MAGDTAERVEDHTHVEEPNTPPEVAESKTENEELKTNSINNTSDKDTDTNENKTKEAEKTNEENNKDETKNGGESKTSHYMQNLKISNSGTGLVLNDKENKEATLLSDSKTVVRFSPVWRQTLASSAAILLTFTAGLTSGYSAILLPKLEQPGSPIMIDASTKSWIAAMAALPMAPGCLIAGWMMEKFGRKTSLYIICVPFLLGWILIACASNLGLMLLGRFFTGLCVGLLGPLGPVYIGETSEPRYRGFFLAAISLAIAIGIFVAHLIGTFMTWQWTATICCLFPILSVLLLMLIPESPTWLISKGEVEQGVKAFGWLRGYSEEANAELKCIIDNQKAADNEPIMTWQEKIKDLRSPELIKPLFIMILFFITCQFSGVNAVAFYSIEIVEKAVGSGLDHYMVMLIIDLVRVAMSVVACVICKQYGRRPLCFISGIWTAIAMVGLSMFLYFKPENLSWVPLTCLTVYICAISIGLVPLPWIMCGEVFPTKVRGLGSGISSATTFVAFFVVVKTAPGMMTHLGEVFTFLIYGVVSLVGTAVMYFILPETKGKSLQEIEERFKHGKKSTELKV
ncbi:facilitated trehalose transporter Tret1-2 homolog [Ostrinia furnacalis]|uniref:facilitated trehalose transporter Tret1-2 homolog n=1 Tax=Ostrinia furnacalis TaxID=93504 RepID=UPI00103FAE95|nr:facilitated trehalose transporter Tret1-2 homolog [Ostrinia furnacalis]XP_028178438.1 facilitated trehalose transporter Tret1-2 homolog [Ostrinia furnacalis]XP_028178439.1 facilitated trehalose transporter Tret1-2 homolog [Ostrinia furnacalis]